MRAAYATLVTNPDYALGALALVRSIRLAGSRAPVLVLASGDADTLEDLKSEDCTVIPVSRPETSSEFSVRHSKKNQHASAPFTKGEKPTFHDPLDNFCKLRIWELTRYDRIVFIDADAIMLQNCDRLFDYPEFCAAPNLYESLADFGRLNSGVFVAAPNVATYDAMMTRLDAPGAFWPRTDQTFLQSFFPDWHGLPYTYNVLQYLYFALPELWNWPALKILHYQYEKPWQRDHGKAERLKPLIELWWRVLEGGAIPDDLPAGIAPETPD